MLKSVRISLTTLSVLIGLYSGFVLGLMVFLGITKILDLFLLRGNLGAGGLLFGVISVFLGLLTSVIFGVLFGMIAWGRFNSENWRINRFVVIIILLILALVVNIAISTPTSPSKCIDIQDSVERDDCWFKVVRDNKDTNFCKNIQDQEKRESCGLLSWVD